MNRKMAKQTVVHSNNENITEQLKKKKKPLIHATT